MKEDAKQQEKLLTQELEDLTSKIKEREQENIELKKEIEEIKKKRKK